jgi:hypothetical protein
MHPGRSQDHAAGEPAEPGGTEGTGGREGTTQFDPIDVGSREG